MSYTELNVKERATIQVGQYQHLSPRAIVRMFGRSSFTISRELRRNQSLNGGYVALVAQAHTSGRRLLTEVLGKERFELGLEKLFPRVNR